MDAKLAKFGADSQLNGEKPKIKKFKRPDPKPKEAETFIGFQLKPVKKVAKPKAETPEDVELKGWEKDKDVEIPDGEKSDKLKFTRTEVGEIPDGERAKLEEYKRKVCHLRQPMMLCSVPLKVYRHS